MDYDIVQEDAVDKYANHAMEANQNQGYDDYDNNYNMGGTRGGGTRGYGGG